jgi:hypothetical protein
MSTTPKYRGVTNTTFDPNADLTAQITGSGNPVSAALSQTPSATPYAIDALLQQGTRYIEITTAASPGALSLTSSTTLNAGARLVIKVIQYSGGSAAVTFSTGFNSTGTVTPSSTNAILVEFVMGVSGKWVELGRTSASVTP